MSRATQAAWAPAAPEGAPLRSGVLRESESLSSETPGSSQDAERPFVSHVGGVLAAPENGQPEQSGDRVAEGVICPNGGREGTCRSTGRRGWTIGSGSRSPSPPPRLSYNSLRTATESPKQKGTASLGISECFQFERLPLPAPPVEQQSTWGRTRERVQSASSQPQSITERMTSTDAKEKCGLVIAEDAAASTEAFAPKSTIPSVLITSPSLGRISVLCAPETSHSAQTGYTAEAAGTSLWPSQPEEEKARALRLVAPVVGNEGVSNSQVNIIPSPPVGPPPPMCSTTSRSTRFCMSSIAGERQQDAAEPAAGEDKGTGRLETRYPREVARQISPNRDTPNLTSRPGDTLPVKTIMAAKRHTGREVTAAAVNGGQPDVAAITSDKQSGRTPDFCPLQLENTITSRTSPSRSSGSMITGRSASHDERHQLIFNVKSAGDSLQCGVPVGAGSRGKSGTTPHGGAVGSEIRRRYSLPAEGRLSDVLRYGGRGMRSSGSAAQDVMSQHDAFSWADRNFWRSHGGRGKENLDKKSRRQSADIVQNRHPEADLRFLAQLFASQSVAGEGQLSVTVGEEGTKLSAAVSPLAAFPPDYAPPCSRGGAEDAHATDRTAADSERKGSRCLTGSFEEGSDAAGKDQRAVLARSVAGGEQNMTLLQQPLMSTGLRAAAHAVAAAARSSTSMTISEEQKPPSGSGGSPASGGDVPRVVTEVGSLVVASSIVDETSSVRLKQATSAAIDSHAETNTTEGSTRDVLPERQLWHREADTHIRTTSGVSMASTSDHSCATRASAERQQLELLLQRAKQHRFVGEAAAVAASVASACVKRVALFPVQRLIVNTLQHWQRSLESIPGENNKLNRVISQDSEHYPLDPQDNPRAQHVSATGASSHRVVHQQEESSPVCCARSFPGSQAETWAGRTLCGIKCVSVPLSDLVRSTLPPASDSDTLRRDSAVRSSAKQVETRESAEQVYAEDTSTENGVSCVRVTLFASKQVLRWRHLRQRVALFTEKTSPYYFWPPWGGYRSFIEAGGSTPSGELESTDTDGGGFTSSRKVDIEQTAAKGDSAGVIRRNFECGLKEENSRDLRSFESATASSRGRKHVASDPQCTSQQEMSEGLHNAAGEATQTKIAQITDFEFTSMTPTKSSPDSEAEAQRDTTATSSSPPVLGEAGRCSSPVLAFAQQKQFNSVDGHSKQQGVGQQEPANGSNSRSTGIDSCCQALPLGSSSPSLYRETPFQPDGQDSCVDTFDVPCASGAVPTPGAGYKARTHKEGIRASRRERTSREENPDVNGMCARDAGVDEHSVLQNYKDKHAVVPFLPNVLAATLTTHDKTSSTTLPPEHLCLPFEEAGTVYVLHNGISDSSPCPEEKMETRADVRSLGLAANNAFAQTEETNCRFAATEACATEESHKKRSAYGPLQDTTRSCSFSDEKDGNWKQTNTEGTDVKIFRPSGNVIAVWACARCRTFDEKFKVTDSEQRGFSRNDHDDRRQAAQKRFWLSADTLADLIRDEANDDTSTGDILRSKEEEDQALRKFQAVLSPPNSTTPEDKSEREITTLSGAILCGRPDRVNHRTLLRTGHQKKAQQVMEAMQMWCKATSKSDKGRDTPQDGTPDGAPGSFKEISLESFASAYNNMAEEALKQVLTQIRTRKGHALPSAANQLLEERARILIRKRKEEARYVQHQLRRKFQQLVQNFNKLVSAELKPPVYNSSSARDSTDASRLAESVSLEAQFQQRLQDLHQRVEYHLHQRRQLAALLMRHKARAWRERRISYAGAQQLSGGCRASRRRLQWYSVGIRWLRTKAAFEYFVVRHRQRDARQLQFHCELADLRGRPRRMQNFNPVNLAERDEQLFYKGLSSVTVSPRLSHNTPSATHPACTSEDRPPAGIKRRLPGGQRRGSNSSSGEEWKNFEQSRGPRGASGAVGAGGQVCGSGRSSVCGDEGDRSAFYLPTVPPVGPVGMSPVTMSEASTPVTPGSPPLSSNEDGLSAVTSKGSSQQQCWRAYTESHAHTSSVLLLHELLQPLRLDAGGIRAALMLVVLRLRRFIRVVRPKEQLHNEEMRGLATCTSTTLNGNPGKAQRTHRQADEEISKDLISTDKGKTVQDYSLTGAKVFTSGREGVSLRAQLSELAKLQNDIVEMSASSAKRSRQGRKPADFTSVTDDVSDIRTSEGISHFPRSTFPDSECTRASFAHRLWANATPQRNFEPCSGQNEPDEAEEKRQTEISERSSISRQFPWSSIRMALVLPNLGVQLEQILPPTRSLSGRDSNHLLMAAKKDGPVFRDIAGFVCPGKYGRYSVYERGALAGHRAETFAALSQTSQQVDSGSPSPAPRRSGGAGVAGVGDAAEARAARAAARAAAAETRNWRLREREEAETRAGALNDHVGYSGEGSACPGRAERSRGRSSPERSIRRADGEGVSEVDGDEEEEETAEERKTTNSGFPSRRTGKIGETDNRNWHAGLTRTPSPQLPQRVTRSCGIPSVTRNEYTAKRKQHWPESDEEPYAADTVECILRTHVHSTVNENEGNAKRVPPIEGGALEPFWWRACCAKFRQRTRPLSEDWKRSEPNLKTACSTEAAVDEFQQSFDAGSERDAAKQLTLKETSVMEDKRRNRVLRGCAGQPIPPSGAKAVENSSRQQNAKSTLLFHDDSPAFKYPAATLQQLQHMVPPYTLLSPSSSESSSTDEECNSGRGTSTTSDSSTWSKHSSISSDVSVEPSTLLQQLSARQVAAGTALLFRTREPSRAGQITRDICRTKKRDASQSSVMKAVEARMRQDGNRLVVEPTEHSTDLQAFSGTVMAAHTQETGQQPTEDFSSAQLPSLPGIGDADELHSIACPSKDCLEESEHSEARGTGHCYSLPSVREKTNTQALDAGERGEKALCDALLLEQIVSALTPRIIVMPSEELVPSDLQTILPQLQVRFTTCAVDLTPNYEVQVLQQNAKPGGMSLRPRRAVRRLWKLLYPILHTLQVFSHVEEGRGGSFHGKPSANPDGEGDLVIHAPNTDGPQLPRSMGTTTDLIYSALWLAAAELARNVVSPQMVYQVEPVKDQSSRKDGIPASRLHNARGGRQEVQLSLPRQVTTLMSRRTCMGEKLPVSTHATMQTYDKLRTMIEDAVLYLSGVLDVEIAQVEALKEGAEGDTLLNLLQFADDETNAPAPVQAPADGDVTVDHHVRGADLDVECLYNGAIERISREAHTGDEEEWRKKKRVKMEAVTQSPSADASGSELRRVKRPTVALERLHEWKTPDILESLFDFGPKKASVKGATSKIALCSPRAFGRRRVGHRLPRLPGLRRRLYGSTSAAFDANEKDEGGTEAISKDRSLKELRFPFEVFGGSDEAVSTRRRESRSRTRLFLCPDGWETEDDESGSSSSVEKTSADAPASSGSESVYLSVPSSPRRRRQKRQLRWRSRHLAVSATGAYRLASAEVEGEFSAEGLDKSVLDRRKRAHVGRTPRHVGVGSVYRIYPNSVSSAGDTVTLQRSSSSQPPSPPLTRGAAATALPASQIYTRAEALPAGQRDVVTKSECTTREGRRTTQQDRQFSRYLPEKLSKRQFAAAPSSQTRKKSGIGRMPRSRAVSVIAAPSLEWSGPECSITTPTRKNTASDATGAPQPSSKGHILAGGIGHDLAASEGTTLALPATGFPRSAASAAARGGPSLDSPRETPRPGRRTPTAGSPVPTGVYFDASRRLWRCQWRENGRFKTKGFSLNTYGTLKDARKACIIYRCLMGGWEVDPRWLADNDSADSGDNGIPESHAPKDDDKVTQKKASRADGSQVELEHGEGKTAQCVAFASKQCDAPDASKRPAPEVRHCDGTDAESRGIAVAGSCESGPAGSADTRDVSSMLTAEPAASADTSP